MNAAMEPVIQYAKTSDGVSIAYAVMGEGTPLVSCVANFGGELHHYTAHSGLPSVPVDALVAAGFRVLIYDNRGMGSSDRRNTDYTNRGRLRDLEAVIEHAGLDRFALASYFAGSFPAIMYAVEHPERISHLILCNGYADGAEHYKSAPVLRVAWGLRSMAEDEWEYYTLLVANVVLGFSDLDGVRKLAEAIRAGISPRAFVALMETAQTLDLSEMLSSVSVPTLVLADNATRALRGFKGSAQGLARSLPNARFIETDDAAHAIREFVQAGGATSAHLGSVDLPSGTAVILFADIADSTALTERLGDTAFRQKARDLSASVRALIRESGGTPVEGPTLGDGVLAAFTSAREAIAAALACAGAGNDAGLPLHLGIHAGDVMREKDPDGRANVYGGAVNIAARIAGASAPGEILVSDIVRGLARTSSGVTFEDRGEQALKGVADPQRLFAVREGSA